jgi:hypothetical protein
MNSNLIGIGAVEIADPSCATDQARVRVWMWMSLATGLLGFVIGAFAFKEHRG